MKKIIILTIVLCSAISIISCNNTAISSCENDALQSLIVAIDRQDTTNIRKIINLNPDLLNRTDSNYNNMPLIRAVYQRKRASVEQLLRLGADPNITSKRGMTPLIKAIDFGVCVGCSSWHCERLRCIAYSLTRLALVRF